MAGRATAPDWVVVDAGDDGAVLSGGQVVTIDALVEGVHFDDLLSPSDVGYKSVAVSVSDLGAMGATPRWAVCALSLPRGSDVLDWVSRFAEGLHEACRAFGVYLVGGDVTAVPEGAPRYVSSTLVGQLTPDRALRRSGARPGDDLWVTGSPGLAGAGWMFLHPPADALAALRRPRPPLAFAQAVAAQQLATAAMDLSDGLGADVPRLATASGVRIELDPEQIPVPASLADHPELRRAQLAGGDDYELLFTAPPGAREILRGLAAAHTVSLSRVGRVVEGMGAALPDGTWPSGFDHFPPGAPS